MFIVLAGARLHFQGSAVSAAWKRTGHLGIERLSKSYSVSTFSMRVQPYYKYFFSGGN